MALSGLTFKYLPWLLISFNLAQSLLCQTELIYIPYSPVDFNTLVRLCADICKWEGNQTLGWYWVGSRKKQKKGSIDMNEVVKAEKKKILYRGSSF